jgi:integrase
LTFVINKLSPSVGPFEAPVAWWARISVRRRRPARRRTRAVRPLAPSAVERLRAHLLAERDLRSATLVSVLAYAGLRPGEALGLTWDHVRERTILVERSVSLGEVKETKTGRLRSVRLLAPLASDLTEWRLASGRPTDDALVFPAAAGGPCTRFVPRARYGRGERCPRSP